MTDVSMNLIGTWKLVSCDTEYQDSGLRKPHFGNAPPKGYLILLPEGRMAALLVGGDRRPGNTEAQQADLFRTMIAYSGRYRFEGDRFITTVDVSWNEEWTGTDQVRFFKLDGDRLDIVTDWLPDPIGPERRMIRGILSWVRDQ